jgi:hypothetical protein
LFSIFPRPGRPAEVAVVIGFETGAVDMPGSIAGFS